MFLYYFLCFVLHRVNELKEVGKLTVLFLVWEETDSKWGIGEKEDKLSYNRNRKNKHVPEKKKAT